MTTVSIHEAKAHLSALIAQVEDRHERVIIATAQMQKLAVVTSDERFRAYGVETLV